MSQALPHDDSSPPSPAPDRRLVRRAALLVATLVVLRLATFEGWIPRVEIAGDSMAPTLLGEHVRLTCPECGATFETSVAGLAQDQGESIVCPNCGARDLDRRTGEFSHGRRAWIDRAIYYLRAVRRGEVVALVDPADSSRRAVKRVVGLPGERVRIVAGDLFVNDRRWQKSLDELRDVAVLVHDDQYRPTRRPKPLPERWRAEPSGWESYHHWRCFESPFARSADSPVLDADSFNVTVSRTLHDVPDLLFESTLTLAANSQALVRIATRDQSLVVVFDAATSRIELRRRGEMHEDEPRASLTWPLVASVPLPRSYVERPTRCEVAVCDRRVLVACERRVLLTVDESAASGELTMATTTPWSVASLGAGTSFARRRVLRDLYWLGPNDASADWQAPRALGPDEYFLLGDNAPVSIDSRQWPDDGAVGRSQILGRVTIGKRER